MTTYEFLSPEWLAALKEIRSELNLSEYRTEVDVRANVSIVGVPFTDTTVCGHLDTSRGALLLDEGHLDDADFAIEMPYALAYQIFVERDPVAFLAILISGDVKLSGDSSKVLGLVDLLEPDHNVIARVDAITLRP